MSRRGTDPIPAGDREEERHPIPCCRSTQWDLDQHPRALPRLRLYPPLPADLLRPLENAHQAQVATIHRRAQVRGEVESHTIIPNLQGYPLSVQAQANPDLVRAGVLAGVLQALAYPESAMMALSRPTTASPPAVP